MKLPDPATVYGLKSTRDGRIRYIGQTQENPVRRLSNHKRMARQGAGGKVGEWMRNEMADGFEVRMSIIVEAGTLNETERLVIEKARAEGYDLLNTRDGGGVKVERRGPPPISASTRARLSKAAKGRKHTAETKAKLSAAWGDCRLFPATVRGDVDRWRIDYDHAMK